MTPVFSARRRAEEFNSLIEHSSGNDLTDARYAEFLEIVSALRTSAQVHARPAFVSHLREQLVLAAETELVPSPEERLTLPARRPRDRRIAAAVGGFALVGATTSMAMAAQTALPGDILYPLKRAIENVETGMNVNEGDKGATMLANASGRLDEVTALSRKGSLEDTTVIAETLNTFTEQATVASDLLLSDYASTGDESSISELRAFTALSMETLAALEQLVPADARDELLNAARVLTQIDAEAEQACPSCAGDGITSIPPILAGDSTFSGTGITADPVGQIKRGGQGTEGGGGSATEPAGNETDGQGNALPPDTVLNPGDSGPEAPDDDGSAGDSSDDAIDDLTEGLVHGGGTQPTSGPSGLPGVPEVEEAVDDATGGLTGNDSDGNAKP